MVYMGYSEFTEEWELVSCRAITPHAFDGKVFTSPSLPPAPICRLGMNNLSPDKVSKLLSAIYGCYDIYGFQHVSWLYWHSVLAPVHMAAAGFGATFEAMQTEYLKSMNGLIKNGLLEPNQWKKVRAQINNLLSEMAAGDDDLEFNKSISALKQRVGSMNFLSQTEMANRFLDSLNIDFSEKERKAWTQRNKSAHGGKTSADEYVELIREVKILRVLCNRVLLAMTHASDQYIDYYTLGFPVRGLKRPMVKRAD